MPYGLKYYPSETSDLFHDAYADNSGFSSWDYISALEAKDEYALKLKSSHIFQCSPFISIEDGELFLGQFQSSLGFDVDDVYASEVLPILRPLSDLTKEITHNGETFVPLVRILELTERNQFTKDLILKSCSINFHVNVIECESKYYSSMPGNIHTVRYAVKTGNMGTLVYSLSYDDRFDRFSKRDETREITLGVGHQLQMFGKLSEWHIDYNNLIGRGLAISIHDIPTKP